jgi:RNA-directed DNA polymerase
MDETQMTAMSLSSTGASPTTLHDWSAIDWRKVEQPVKRLQMRIAKATKESRTGKVKALQRLLTTSYYAKLLAIRRVTTSSGSKTPGVDGVTWQTASVKLNAAKQLNKRSYRAQPLRRVNIPKKNGKTRPLGIPTMKDRAMQALYLLALEPISETLADGHSYGFRPKRSAADAIEQCFIALSRGDRAEWILEGDIKACFDQINHQWLLDNILLDKSILSQWLKAGYVEKAVFHDTAEGTPQGGIISPTLANMALDSMADAISNAVTKKDKCNFVRYADDFIITGASRQILEEKVKPAIEKFLSERGLQLSEEKTLITHIDEGFDFLGFNVRKYKGKLLIKPSKKSVKALMEKIHEVIFSNKTTTAGKLIEQLNPIIRGWANYYRHVVSKRTFSKIDNNIFQMLRRWCKRRHPNKKALFWKNKYFRRIRFLDWIFYGRIKKPDGNINIVHLIKAAHTNITRHIKIRSDANPHDPEYKLYFEKRGRKSGATKEEYAGNRSKRLLGQELGF